MTAVGSAGCLRLVVSGAHRHLHHPQQDQSHEFRDFGPGAPHLAERGQRGRDHQDAGDDVGGRGVETEVVEVDTGSRLLGMP